MQMTLPEGLLVALVGAVVTLIVGVVNARREARKSAAEMYTELCQQQQARIGQLQGHLERNEAEIAALQKDLEELRAENRNLRGRISELERENESLRTQIAALRRETGCAA